VRAVGAGKEFRVELRRYHERMVGDSAISTRRPSGEIPEKTMPPLLSKSR